MSASQPNSKETLPANNGDRQSIPWESGQGFLWGLPATVWLFIRHPKRAFGSMRSLSLFKLHLFVILALLFIDIIDYIFLTVLDLIVKFSANTSFKMLAIDEITHLFDIIVDQPNEAWPTAIISLFAVSYARAYVQNLIHRKVFCTQTSFSGLLRVWLYSSVGEVWAWSIMLLSFPGVIWAYVILPIIGTKVVLQTKWKQASLSVLASLIVSFLPATLLLIHAYPPRLLVTGWIYEKWDPTILVPDFDLIRYAIANW